MTSRVWRVIDDGGATCICIAVATMLYSVLAGIDRAQFVQYLPMMAHGVAVTAMICLVTFGAGFCCALAIVLVYKWGPRPLKMMAEMYIQTFRFTPLLAQLYLVYFGAGEFSSGIEAAGLWWLFADPLNCVLLVFTLNTAAYQAYIIVNSFKAVDKSQIEAGLAFGLPWTVTFAHILLPLAFMTSLRPLANEFQKMVKASSIASVVTVLDLLGSTKMIYSETLNFDFYVICALVYLSIVWTTGRAADALERRVLRHLPAERNSGQRGLGKMFRQVFTGKQRA